MRKDCLGPLSFLLIVCALRLFLYADDARCEQRKHFLWKAESKTTTLYLLGSLHFLKEENYPLPQEIEAAFDASAVLAVEANINDVGGIDITKLMESAFYTGTDTLEKHLSRETYETVRKRLEGSGMPPELIARQKPWFLALTLTSLELAKMGFDPAYGIDKHFLSRAQGKKKIIELESIDYQINLLSGFSDREQELFLSSTLKDLDLIRSEAGILVKAWENGDVKEMEALLSKSATNDKGLSSISHKLLDERNAKMCARIEEFLKTKESYIVVVGAAHLIGKKGIVEMLRRKGYPVKQL